MYAYIKGILTKATPTEAVLETHGIGYYFLIPFNNFSQLPVMGTQVTFFTSFIVREDSQKLFGFLEAEQRDLFEALTDVSGIGPKTALCLVGHMPLDELSAAIGGGNTQRICKIPGIGKKTAERLIVEMRDKIKKRFNAGTPEHPIAEQGLVADAVSALVNLGYNSGQAQKAVQSTLSKSSKEPELAKLITDSLRNI